MGKQPKSVIRIPSFNPQLKSEDLTNHTEYSGFLRTALAWRGSVTPIILPRVFWAGLYATVVCWVVALLPEYQMSVTPFEYTGAVLGLLLVSRINAGMDRWWEARKIWGNIVNQSRNLAVVGFQYSGGDAEAKDDFLRWVAVWPYAMCGHLRDDRGICAFARLTGDVNAQEIAESPHMPMFVGSRVAASLAGLRKFGLDDFAFHHAERQRSLLVDAIGACERIRSTPIPFVLAIKTRRFIFLFLLLLPIALIPQAGWLTPLIMVLTAYPLLCLDEIGVQLQSPFDPESLSHLPLVTICKNIENNIQAVKLA